MSSVIDGGEWTRLYFSLMAPWLDDGIKLSHDTRIIAGENRPPHVYRIQTSTYRRL